MLLTGGKETHPQKGGDVFKNAYLFLLLFLICVILAGCGRQNAPARNPDYENQKIIIEGDIAAPKEVTVGEMRALPQKNLDASFNRTTGLLEEFKAAGPVVKDALALKGINYKDYKGIGFVGRDGYYCLVTPEILRDRELILALTVNGEDELQEDLRPARLCAQGEFGPYWVRMVEKIVLYKEIPEKNIVSTWVFKNLAEGIEPYPYEYYGSKDDAIELAQIFSRFDNVNSKAFFTMKSSDGFKKNEALNMVSKDYYIKIAGQDAPTNMAPNIKLGMNVQHIAWFSTNEDAAVFPEEIIKLTGELRYGGHNGIPLQSILSEVQVKNILVKQFELTGADGKRVKVSGQDLARGILLVKDDGTYPVVWDEGAGFGTIGSLLRIRSVQ